MTKQPADKKSQRLHFQFEIEVRNLADNWVHYRCWKSLSIDRKIYLLKVVFPNVAGLKSLECGKRRATDRLPAQTAEPMTTKWKDKPTLISQFHDCLAIHNNGMNFN